METGPREWPSAEWQLTAPESYVLRLPRPRRHVELLHGVLVGDFAKEARREFTGSLVGYLNNHVYPSLVQRRLMEVEEPAALRAFRRGRHVRTAAGDQALAELEEWLRVGNACMKDWARDSPERALAYTGGAGAAVLLMPGLYPELDRIGRQVLGADAAIGHGWAADFGGFDAIDAGFDAGGSGGGWGGDGGGGGNGGGGGGN